MDIGDIMTRAVQTCRLNDTLEHAAQLMWDCDCGSIPVVDAQGRAIAMITDRDICMAAYTQGRPLASISVRSAASSRLYSVGVNSTVEAAQALMEQQKIRRVVVIDKDRFPVGIVSVSDLVRHTGGVSRHLSCLSQDSVVRTLASICLPSIPHFAAAAE